MPSFAYLPRWTPASRQPQSVADRRVLEDLLSWDWGTASGLWAGVGLSESLKGLTRELEREAGRLGLLSVSRPPPGAFPTSSRGSSWRSRPVSGQWKETN